MQMIALDGLRLATLDEGAGPPVLLVHAFPFDHTVWRRQIEVLADRYRVIAPDLRGFGQSPPQGEVTTMEQMADDLAALLDALEIDGPVVYGGISMGGYIAWEFYRKYAERVRAMILCDTRSAPDTPELAAARRETARRLLVEGTGFLAESMAPRFFSPHAAGREALLDYARATIGGNDPRGVAAAALGMAQRADATPRLAHIACPVLLVAGADDALTPPEEMRGLAEAIGGAELEIIPRAGHLSPLENPAAANAAILRFLTRLAEAGTATGS